MGVKVREKVKGSGEWWVFVNHKGQRKSRKVGEKKTANQVKRGIEREIAQGLWNAKESNLPTLSAQGQKFIDSPLREWSERTRIGYQRTFNNHIKPALGNKLVDQIEIKDIKDLLETVRGKGLSPNTTKAILKVVSIILEDCREDGLIKQNPCVRMGKHTGKGTVKKPNPLEVHEVEQLLENVKKLDIGIATLILIGVRTGMRIGEMLALEWTDIDFDKRTAEVTKSYDYHNYQVKATKTETTRSVRLTPQTVEALKELREKRICKGNVIFCDEKGKYLTHRKVERWLHEIRPKEITLHDLRHTYASLRLGKGDNLLDVSKQLGHKSVKITLDTYGHWMKSDEYVVQVDELDTLHLSAPQMHPEVSRSTKLH